MRWPVVGQPKFATEQRHLTVFSDWNYFISAISVSIITLSAVSSRVRNFRNSIRWRFSLEDQVAVECFSSKQKPGLTYIQADDSITKKQYCHLILLHIGEEFTNPTCKILARGRGKNLTTAPDSRKRSWYSFHNNTTTSLRACLYILYNAAMTGSYFVKFI